MTVLETKDTCDRLYFPSGHKRSSHPTCSSETLKRWSLATVPLKLIRLWLPYNQKSGRKWRDGFWGRIINDRGASALFDGILILDPFSHHGNKLTTMRFHALRESNSLCRKTPWGKPSACMMRGGMPDLSLLSSSQNSPQEQPPCPDCPA